jgi:hypothetical protein
MICQNAGGLTCTICIGDDVCSLVDVLVLRLFEKAVADVFTPELLIATSTSLP